VRRAAAVKGESMSQFIRTSAEERADKILTVGRSDPFADVTGVVPGGGGHARRSGEAFTEALVRRQAKE